MTEPLLEMLAHLKTAGRLSGSLSLAARGLSEHILLLVDGRSLHQPLGEAMSGRHVPESKIQYVYFPYEQYG